MIVAVADTHAVLWYLMNDPRLSPPARQQFEDAARQGAFIGVSSISFVEVLYLINKGRLAPETLPQFIAQFDVVDSPLVELPISRFLMPALEQVPRHQVPDLPDRIIAATALYCRVPLLTCDARIRQSIVQTVW